MNKKKIRFQYTNILIQIFSICVIGITPIDIMAQEYFQQEVNYTIDVTLDDVLHELNAFEKIEYINNSPDTLHYLFFHLWPNGYSGNNTRLAKELFESGGRSELFKNQELRGYIDSLDFKVSGQGVKCIAETDSPDICQVFLNSPLHPGDTIIITTPFRVKIPKGTTSRLGHIGESYQITQWYPKPAVYDQNGWHPMPYLNQGEFYSEFGSFDVTITLPSNYRVGATGNLQTREEIRWLEDLAADDSWKSSMYYGGTLFPPSSEKLKTLRYTGDRIHDFAWFADKRFHVMKGKVTLPGSGKEVTTWTMFTNYQARLWQYALNYVNNSIWYFSHLVGDYPYENYTAVQSALSAGLGMEYPGITVIGSVNDNRSLDEVIAHEAAHSWFYGALGSDERRYPFMDESITSAYTRRYMKARYPDRKLWEIMLNNRWLANFLGVDEIPVERAYELEWLIVARKNLDQPADLPSEEFSDLNYVHILYNKAASGFEYLRAYLGDSLFDSAMQSYYDTWKFRHPQPNDLEHAFESHAGKDLDWFFEGFISTTKRLDYKIADLKENRLLIENNGTLASPLVITGMDGDSVVYEQWADGFHGSRWIDVPDASDFSSFVIDRKRVMPEINRKNNYISTSGILPKLNPVKPRFLFAIEDPAISTLVYIPLVNWNRFNGFTPGIALHNGYFLPKPFNYLLVPFYSTKNNALIGIGQTRINITPFDKMVRLAEIRLEGARFGAPGNQIYQKVGAGLDLHFRPGRIRSPYRQNAFGNYYFASDLYQIVTGEKADMKPIMQVGYNLEKRSSINPFSILSSFEFNRDYQKAAAVFNYRFSYFGDEGLDLRLFTGRTIKNTSATPFYGISPGGRSGREQYLYQGIFIDRFRIFTENFWSRQMLVSEGGLVSNVSDDLGYSEWLVSLSLTSTLPGKADLVPVRPFANFLLNDHGLAPENDSPFFFEAGLKAGVWNVFEIYFPFFVSKNISSAGGPLKERIRFTITLDPAESFRLSE